MYQMYAIFCGIFFIETIFFLIETVVATNKKSDRFLTPHNTHFEDTLAFLLNVGLL